MISDLEINISLNYWLHRIPEQQAKNVASTVATILHSIVTQDKAAIRDINTFSQHNQIDVTQWNSDIPSKVDACVHELISKQAKSRSSSPAILAWDGQFTYSEIDELSTSLAHHLIQLGAGPEVLIPICFEKSAWTIIAMLAINKSGAAFVPLDPSNPEQRRQYICNQLGSDILLASPATKSLWNPSTTRIVEVSPETVNALPTIDQSLGVKVSSNNAMYIIFTSGSTGAPKGVVLEHSAVATSITHHGRAMGFTTETRALQFAAYNFDASITEIFTTLLYGGCICVPSDSQRIGDLATVINDMEVNWSLFTPSVIALLNPNDIPSLKTLVLGGEAMTKDNVRVWSPNTRLINAYGPTETCVLCVARDVGLNSKEQTIGKAVSSVSWIVDPNDHNQLMPVGCVGELLIEGHLLARGYLGDSEKTAASFITDPTWAKTSGVTRRMYKTGDLVCYNPDGTLDYCGRKDGQVKISGQRLELGEVEHHINQNLPKTSQVVVDLVTRVGSKGGKTLTAFICSKDNQSLEGGCAILPVTDEYMVEFKALEESLASGLPAHMVPKVYVPLTQIPFTTSGKTDRRRLRSLASEISDENFLQYSLSRISKTPATTEMEIKLVDMWADVLGIETTVIGADDSFFRLGGDSYRGMRLAKAARSAGLELSVANVFKNPTLSEMAKVMTTLETEVVDENSAPFALLGDDDNLLDDVLEGNNLIDDILNGSL